MVPGLCEVVLHDLRDPRHAIRVIENNLSSRRVGDSATEPGWRASPIRSLGEYIAALNLNLDVSVLSPVTLALANLVATETGAPPHPGR